LVSSSVVFEPQTLTPDWQWRSWHDLPYLTCSLLNNWQHGFFTQQFYPQLPEQLINIFDGDTSVSRVKQVHGNLVLTPQEIITWQQNNQTDRSLPDGDGVISDEANRSLWVASADCNPVLIGDVVTGRVAAVHAGWRGTAQKIIPKTIDRFLRMGSSLQDLRIAMGAAISGESYQVSELVAAQVGSTLVNAEITEQTEILKTLRELPLSPLLEDNTPNRVKLDVRIVNQLQLQHLGIAPEQIAIAPFCTYQGEDLWFSYRRTNQKKVQWSGIVSK
jgi:hypothetical protein